MKKLPIGIQCFADIRNGNYCYADKTSLIAQLVDQGRFCFLARPRRFGKSLLLDTLAETFAGNKELFQGLYLENNRDWQVTHPVIKIDFAQGILTSRQQLDTIIADMVQQHATAAEIVLAPHDEVQLLFAQLIRELHQKTGQQVVVLVDEYDKPILDNITDTDF